MQITKISVVSHLRMLLLIFDSKDPLGALSFTIFDCFTEPDQGSICITKVSIIRPSITSNIQTQSTRYRTKHWRQMRLKLVTNKNRETYESSLPCHIALRKAKMILLANIN